MSRRRAADAIAEKDAHEGGSRREKIPYTLNDLRSMQIFALVVYAGEGFSSGVLHLLGRSEIAAYCLPEASLDPTASTLEFDHVVAVTFGWWDAVLHSQRAFNLEKWAPSSS